MIKRLVVGVGFAALLGWQVPALTAHSQDEMQAVRVSAPQTKVVQPSPPQPAKPPEAVVESHQEGVPRQGGQWGAGSDANVRIEVTISYQVGNATPVKRSAVLTVADQESGLLRAGNQVAVPSTTFLPATKSDGVSTAMVTTSPMTQFTYRSVGLNLDARRVAVSGNRAKVSLNVEFSAVDEKTSEAVTSVNRPPSFPTFTQSFTLVLESGKPVIVAQSSDFVDNVERKQSVEVKATILR
jgi:hypothetical protein